MTNPYRIIHCVHCGSEMELELDIFENGKLFLYACNASNEVHTAFDERTDCGDHRILVLKADELDAYLPENYERTLPLLERQGEGIPF